MVHCGTVKCYGHDAHKPSSRQLQAASLSARMFSVLSHFSVFSVFRNNRNVNKWLNSHYTDRGANEITISSYCWMCQLISPLALLACLDVNWMPPVTLSPLLYLLLLILSTLCVLFLSSPRRRFSVSGRSVGGPTYTYKFRVHCVSARFYFVCVQQRNVPTPNTWNVFAMSINIYLHELRV